MEHGTYQTNAKLRSLRTFDTISCDLMVGNYKSDRESVIGQIKLPISFPLRGFLHQSVVSYIVYSDIEFKNDHNQ
jgi:hypothetical protein